MFFKAYEKNQILSKKGRSFQQVKETLLTQYHAQIVALSEGHCHKAF